MVRAGAAGMVIARGECLPVAGALPLLPVAAALGELAGVDGGRLLEAALGKAPRFVRAEIGRLLPQLGPGGGPGAGAGPHAGRPRAYPISLHTAATTPQAPPQNEIRELYGLTGRELAVLRLVAAGRSNAQMEPNLFHQPRDRCRPRDQHLARARRHQPGAGRRPDRTRRPLNGPAPLNPSARDWLAGYGRAPIAQFCSVAVVHRSPGEAPYPGRKSSRSWLMVSGASSCIQWPGPSIRS